MIAISTAFDRALIAIDINGKIDYVNLDGKLKQSESVLPYIDKLLHKNGVRLQDNDSFAVVVGPGSFTGLRVGCAIVKGLCAGSQKPCKVTPISSFDFMAKQFLSTHTPKTNFVCVINALSGLLYVCEFDKLGKKAGEGRIIEKSEFDAINLEKVGLKDENLGQYNIELSPQILLDIAKEQLKAGNLIDFKQLCPVYMRKSQAEDNLDNKTKKIN